MARRAERNPDSADGDWYIDSRCINCAASREVAPELIVSRNGKSVFARQPAGKQEERAAWRALLLCPTASVGSQRPLVQPPDLFPQEIAPGVFRCGYNARSSFGAHSYLIRRERGNVLIDSPRWVKKLAQSFERMGGLSHILLSHKDDVADASRYADHFGARVWIHEDDRESVPFAGELLRGVADTEIDEGLLAIAVPGHTRGSVVYSWRNTYLFTGDSLAWSRARRELIAFRDVCWYSWEELRRSLDRLGGYPFEWVLPGHGHSVRLPAAEMNRHLRELVERM